MPGHLVCQTPRRTPLGGSREPQAVGAAQKEFLANGWPTQGRRKAWGVVDVSWGRHMADTATATAF